MSEKYAGDSQIREPKSALPFLVDSLLAVEKVRVSTQVRNTHLERRKTKDIYTQQVIDLLNPVEDQICKWASEEIKKHPAYPWFSRINGIGLENIAKVVGMIDVRKAPTVSSLWKFAGFHVVNKEIEMHQQVKEIEDSIEALRKKLGAMEKKSESGEKEKACLSADKAKVVTLEALNEMINSLYAVLEEAVSFPTITRGYAPRPVKGEKLSYNKELRTMCNRLGSSLLKAGIRQFCTVCGAQRPPKKNGENEKESEEIKIVCLNCGFDKFESKAVSNYGRYYLTEKHKFVAQCRERNIRIIPTLELPKNSEGKTFEPVSTISEKHVHMRTERKMLKLVLSHFWLVAREAMGLPTNKPYAHGVLGHTNYIGPWEMVDKEGPKAKLPRQSRKAAAVEAIA